MQRHAGQHREAEADEPSVLEAKEGEGEGQEDQEVQAVLSAYFGELGPVILVETDRGIGDQPASSPEFRRSGDPPSQGLIYSFTLTLR